MKKLFTYLFKKAQRLSDPKFSVRKIVKEGKTEWLPMVKGKGLFTGWMPIVKIYNRYEAMPYEVVGGLNEQDCIDHIDGYKQQLERDKTQEALVIEYLDPQDVASRAS